MLVKKSKHVQETGAQASRSPVPHGGPSRNEVEKGRKSLGGPKERRFGKDRGKSN